MKGFFLFCSIIYLGLFSLDLAEIREQYRNAAEDQYNTYELYKVLSPITESEAPELVAYKGAATTLMAKYAAGIKAKKAYIREGKRLIEYAIELFPSNIELRYIRLSVQENAPKVMGYKGQITEDKEFIKKHYNNISDASLKKLIKGFVLQSTSFSEAEKQLF